MSPFIPRLLGMSRVRKRVLQVAVDTVLLSIVFAASIWLRLEFAADARVWLAILPVVPFTLLLFIRFGLYRAVIHYAAARAIAVILLASVLSGLALFLTVGALNLPIPGSVPVIYAVLTLLCIGASRFGLRQLLVTNKYQSKKQAVIYGAGASGRQLLQKLRQGGDYQPIAFVDDAGSARGTVVDGLRVYDPAELGPLIQSSGVEAVLLALPSVSRVRRRDILKTLEAHAVHVRSVPDWDALLTGKARIDQLCDIGIEDLMGRDPVVAGDRLSGNILDKVVMVTGAGGDFGGSLCRQILRHSPRHLVLHDLSEEALLTAEQQVIAYALAHGIDAQITAVSGSVQMAHQIERSLRRFRVQTLYHAAASQYLPLDEGQVVEGIRNNVSGTAHVAKAAVAAGLGAFIVISTDKAMQPANVMTASRRMAEMLCQSLAQSPAGFGTTIAIVRIGNLLEASGSIVPLICRDIVAGGLIRLPHPEMARHFMATREAAQLVLQAGAIAKSGQVLVLDMGAPVRIAELAGQMARLRGLKPVLVSARRAVKARWDRRDRIRCGQIGMFFSDLRPGEQLCEKPMLGRNPKATAHPRILTTTAICPSPEALAATLHQLELACDRKDIGRIGALLAEAQTGYQPQHDRVEHSRAKESGAPATKVASPHPERDAATGGGLALA